MNEIITSGDRKQAGVRAAMTDSAEPATTSGDREPHANPRFAQRIALRPVGLRVTPELTLPWVLGFLALGACIAPWRVNGWRWFALIGMTIVLLACYDALALWIAGKRLTPVLLLPESGLRGREGQILGIPLALTNIRRRRGHELRVGVMAATPESESAIRTETEPRLLKLEQPDAGKGEAVLASTMQHQLWPWTPELALLRRGCWPGPRVGIEQRSRLRVWCLRRWFDVPEPVRIEADLRPGRREILRSPVYRALVASQQTPWAGHGRDFERLREYQPGDTYSEIAWKSTARRAAPVTRLFQWEQKQEVYFIVDQSRASALALNATASAELDGTATRAPRRFLDLALETALVGATVALELGDDFGLVTYADEPKSWLRAGSGQLQFRQFRERMLNVEASPTTADYEALFADIRVRLRRRAYLLVLADLAERSVWDSFCRGVNLVRTSHAVLITSILPSHARPAFSSTEELRSEQDVYAALAGDKENQRLGTLTRHMSQLNVNLRFIPAHMFLRTAVEGYLENKREQRL